MKKRRLGVYQRAVITGIARVGRQPVTIKSGYSRQVKSLKRHNLIRQRGNFLYLTRRGRKHL